MLLLFAIPLTTLLIWVLVACIVFGALYWLITRLIPEPIQKWMLAAVVILAVIVLIKILLQFAGGEPAL
jgi:VIT1/CCC1 family predicted Fe2+/Mn2+ transporter